MKEVISIVGGRLSYLGKVAKAKDMKEHAEHLLAVEKAWLRSQIGLIEDCDDDVMDEVSWVSLVSQYPRWPHVSFYACSRLDAPSQTYTKSSKNGVHARGFFYANSSRRDKRTKRR